MNNTTNQLPALIMAGTRSGALCLSVLDSASIPRPLQPEEAKRLCSLTSLVLLRVERSAGPSPKISLQDVVLGDASYDDVMGFIKDDLGHKLESLVALQMQEDAAARLASLKQFLLKQLGTLVDSPDIQFFGMEPLVGGLAPSVAADGGGKAGPALPSDLDPSSNASSRTMLVAPSLLAHIQDSLALAASKAPSQEKSLSGASKRSSSAPRIPKKKKACVSQNRTGEVPSVREYFPSSNRSSIPNDSDVPASSSSSAGLSGPTSDMVSGSTAGDEQVRGSVYFISVMLLL